MLYDIEVQHINEKHLIIKCVFDKNTPPSHAKRWSLSFENSVFFKRLNKEYNLAVLFCYRDGQKIPISSPEEAEKVETEAMKRFENAMGLMYE